MNTRLPRIIQGGMGVNISSPHLARTVSMLGQQGTVSGVALERVLARMLQNGDVGGHFRRALSTFPFPDVASRVFGNYFVEGGISDETSYKAVPPISVNPSTLFIELVVCANYAFVWLAKEGHDGLVSINYLEKIAVPHIYAITGAMLAGVDCITMGAGIPLEIPAVINAIMEGKVATYSVPVIGKNITKVTMSFDPESFFGKKLPLKRKPRFIPIIASNLLGDLFASIIKKGKMSRDDIFGFVVEEPTAGGHNAPPRKAVRDEKGMVLPVYGEKDKVDYAKIQKLGFPFWIGGSYATPQKLKVVIEMGASGIQAGSIFALSEESGMDPTIRKLIRRLGYRGELRVRTDMRISPTGYPFKLVCLPGTASELEIYDARPRICDQSALVDFYEKPDGTIGARCPSEPVDRYVAKGGLAEETVGRGCLCNGLVVTAGIGNRGEVPIVTMGDDVGFLQVLMKDENSSYTAEDAIKWLLEHTVV
ncbi:nitronate monooxygenase [Candidatus Nomurabacteria bacterium]|nr:nitronate monooxygenase [Candidatus Nomurabacteria bacterium]